MPPVDAPSEPEALKLIKIVEAKYGDWLRVRETTDLAEIRRALIATSLMYRKALPSKYSFAYLLDYANTLLIDRLGSQSVSGPAFLLAAVVSGDIEFRRPALDRGEILEVGLDPYSGARACGRWRDVIAGKASLCESAPSIPLRRQAIERGPARTFQQRPDGSFRVVGDNESLW